MKLLVLNSGSSSIKYQLFEMPDETVLSSGLVDRIGQNKSTITYKYIEGGQEQKVSIEVLMENHAAALEEITKLLTDSKAGILTNADEVEVIGHRVVHGGEAFAATIEIGSEVKQKISDLATLAPLHNPSNLTGIEVSEKVFPSAKQVAVFDTAFHQTMPNVAYRYAIPTWMYKDLGIRAYGFHGTSHRYVTSLALDYLQNDDASLISIHLGNGASMTATRAGKSVDTSMGLGPMGGLVMGTRCGDIDPSIIFHLVSERGYDPKRLSSILNIESGLLGMSGHSDMRDTKKTANEGNLEAKLILDIFAYRIKKYIGAYAAILNGIDGIIFTGGIGENDMEMRELVCENMSFIGVSLDHEKNMLLNHGVQEINSAKSKVKILVIPTNEELEICRQAYALIV